MLERSLNQASALLAQCFYLLATSQIDRSVTCDPWLDRFRTKSVHQVLGFPGSCNTSRAKHWFAREHGGLQADPYGHRTWRRSSRNESPSVVQPLCP